MARILVSMPDKFLNKIDKIADSEKRTRSELIREALRNYIKNIKMPDYKKSSQNAQLLDEMLK